MHDSKSLRIYLNDHLGGAVAGSQLAGRMLKSNLGTSFEDDMRRLADEIDEDRVTLEGLIDRLGIPQDRVKKAAGWAAEKMGRLKLNGRIVGYSDLSRLIELEGLKIGITGKIGLWESLKQVSEGSTLEGTNLDDLIARARSQRDLVDRLHARAAAIALGR